MAFRFEQSGALVPVEITDARRGATVADLAAVLRDLDRDAADRPSGPWTCAADGSVAPPATPLDEWPVRRGATVSLTPVPSTAVDPDGPTADSPPTPPDRLEARVVAGLDAGGWITIGDDEVVVGRERLPSAGTPGQPADLTIADPTVSRHHLRLRRSGTGPDGDVIVRVGDLGARNGAWIGSTPVSGSTEVAVPATVRIGSSRIELTASGQEAPLPSTPPSAPGRVRLPGEWMTDIHRPPRAPRPTPTPLRVPTPPDVRPPLSPPGLATLLIPLLLGGAMVIVLHSLLWGLFALSGPLLLLAGYGDQRRQRRRHGRRASRRYGRALASFAVEAQGAHAAERTRRRATAPDLSTLLRTARTPTGALWAHRIDAAATLHVRVGITDLPWDPPWDPHLTGAAPDGAAEPAAPLDARVEALIDDLGPLSDVPADVHLGPDAIVGIVGPPLATRAVARALLLRCCIDHGPADLSIETVSHDAGAWAWTRWLPHSRGEVPAAVGLRIVEVGVSRPARAADPDPTRAPASSRTVVLAPHVDLLPAETQSVIELLDPFGTARIVDLTDPGVNPDVQLEGVTSMRAEDVACALAGYHDPAGPLGAGHDAPHEVRLLDLLADPPAAGRATTAAIGVDAEGPVTIDLVADGPHLLIAGTTGSGKSELLRTLIAGLVVGVSPAALTLLLVDFKGGSAFDRCAELPHTVGLLTDLTPALIRRTMESLEAELRRRERILQATGAGDLDAYDHARRRGGAGADVSLPRLVVLVDEFATLARDHPAALDALVSVAQRGRSLGVHLVLATQRPAGVVSEHIKANMNLRIALRLRDAADATDVVGCDLAARLPRDAPGRAVVAAGGDPPRLIRVATVSHARRSVDQPPVTLEIGHRSSHRSHPSGWGRRPIDLDLIVDAARDAHRASGAADPPPVCLPPLPPRLTTADIDVLVPARDATPHDRVVVGLSDHPSEQRQARFSWAPSDGGLVVVGTPGSGRSTTLVALAAAWARARRPEDAHLYALVPDDTPFAPLATWPHTGAVTPSSDPARQARLVRSVATECRRRRATGRASTLPEVLLCIDDVEEFLTRWDDPLDDLRTDLDHLVTQGAAVGVHVCLSTRRILAIPAPWLGSTSRRWILRVADASEAAGLDADLCDPRRPPGRVWALPDQVSAQIALPDVGDPDAPPGNRTAPPVVVLPARLTVQGLRTDPADDGWFVPIGRDEDLAPTGWVVRDGEHVVVVGPPRSGRSTALDALAAVLSRAACDDATVLHTSGRPVADRAPHQIAASASSAAADGKRVFVLVDDADRLPDDGDGLAALIAAQHPRIHVVAALTADAARRGFGHFTRTLRASRQALLLQPDLDLDGELVGVRLPRRPTTTLCPGRGYLIADGRVRLVQVATPAADLPPTHGDAEGG